MGTRKKLGAVSSWTLQKSAGWSPGWEARPLSTNAGWDPAQATAKPESFLNLNENGLGAVVCVGAPASPLQVFSARRKRWARGRETPPPRAAFPGCFSTGSRVRPSPPPPPRAQPCAPSAAGRWRRGTGRSAARTCAWSICAPTRECKGRAGPGVHTWLPARFPELWQRLVPILPGPWGSNAQPCGAWGGFQGRPEAPVLLGVFSGALQSPASPGDPLLGCYEALILLEIFSGVPESPDALGDPFRVSQCPNSAGGAFRGVIKPRFSWRSFQGHLKAPVLLEALYGGVLQSPDSPGDPLWGATKPQCS